jgi:hypothetical protein
MGTCPTCGSSEAMRDDAAGFAAMVDAYKRLRARVAALESMLQRCVDGAEKLLPALYTGSRDSTVALRREVRRVLDDARALLDDTQPTREGT